jgi:hypothetical protein
MFSKKNLLLAAPVILAMIIDLVFTVTGQPDSYWTDFSNLNEGSPLGIFFLSRNPILFLIFFLVYILFVLFLITKLKRPLNIMVAIGFFLGHVWGSSTWLWTIFYKITKVQLDFKQFWYLEISYVIFVAVISGLCINRWLKIYDAEKN